MFNFWQPKLTGFFFYRNLMVYWCSLNGFSLSKLDFRKEEEVEGGCMKRALK